MFVNIMHVQSPVRNYKNSVVSNKRQFAPSFHLVLNAMWRTKYIEMHVQFSSIQFSSVSHSCPTLCDPMDCSTPGLPVHHQLPEFTKFMSIESVMHPTILSCCSLLFLPSIFPSIRIFSNESVLPIRWPKC